MCPLDSSYRGFSCFPTFSEAIVLLIRGEYYPFAGCPCYALRHASARIQEQHCKHHEAVVCKSAQ